MQINFFQHPPSSQWEPVSIPRIPGLSVWVWFRPQHLPGGMMVTIPPEVISAYPGGLPVTLADLLQATGVPPQYLHSISMYGGEWQPGPMMAQYLGHAVPLPPQGGRQELMLNISQATVLPTGVGGIPPGGPQLMMPVGASPDSSEPGESDDEFSGDDRTDLSDRQKYERVESAWRSSIQMERQMTGLRQKLSSILNTLGKLDRDLHPDERLAADREDRDAWHDTRRWIRDMAARCHREIKSFDIGMTSAAGKRNWMEETFQNIIEPRRPTNELEKIRREFESYRKDMVNLQKAMHAALQGATTNGTQRAQRVLNTISRKIRERRAKMREPLGGTNMDRSVRRKS